jgi:phosphoribosylanthranilate isomerase
MFRIKICGITNVVDALAASAAGADAIGLNFFNKSSRFVAPETARQIAAALPASVTKVGVFVNHLPDEITRIVDQVGLNCIQLHGGEPPSIMDQLPAEIPIIRAWQSSNEKLEALIAHLALCRLAGRSPDALLFDAASNDKFGGTGHVADWQAILHHQSAFADTPLILAGGLTPENVARAIAAVNPAAVDVASGIELSPGIKSHQKMQHFIATAHQSFSIA